MESDLGKLFIGGISWDTDEDRLRSYFGAYGEVVEAVIMRDRTTGRARGFGFIVFADPAVAERVVMEKHMIDGRPVEAKKAVPRDDHHITSKNSNSNQGSPGPGRTKKIFVGGLASTVTENDFKLYFDQFGTITDVVVMYDHNTQRPRGFGFITYDQEEAVDRVLQRTFHELNGKMVEVKRAVPKELSPGPTRSPVVGYNYGLGRTNNFLNSYAQGYDLSPIGGYGVRMDGRLSQVLSGRSGFSPFSSLPYGMNMGLEPGLSPSFGGNSSFSDNLGYERILGLNYGGNLNRYNTPIGYNVGNGRSESFLNSPARNVWGGNVDLNSSANINPAGTFFGSGNGSLGVIGNSSANYGSSPVSAQVVGSASGYNSRNIDHGGGENNYRLGATGIGRNIGPGRAAISPFVASTGDYERSHGDLYSANSRFVDAPWQSTSAEVDDSSSFRYGLGTAAESTVISSEGFVGSYSIADRQASRGNTVLQRMEFEK
ncbi:hypothetical protein DCAR_0417864 [Daucus carota subsp. sativus]|uniref:RRM domain-containing protein n=1 Tax=Daucus carota subsp. sativus TaxID=79200 RepID=A0AAF1AZP2_DAUCS|nr:PREDICTED: heterogeneous nuclear ribonucleoprotein 1 isoform X1 [Daucus carota subsp. sativus]XP_017248145.1 PREDICTED: heterogeneous nuclear ribonucleoprotein 1 isoform X2 [Daucus carota subsp. sativus]XP_017248146.1 PREDICTED: heterogeneous nuclear ribonucleoprotein 1 isoform X3 [Daucus carota subsp. sativus]XP_017248147.1 PREDICTED: heterogeneous nuclear ribonucleoprotein 1 isoform X3 [Daucus carota subsp. sativus]WOG98521.1 hypothetical protein DCAR_0417864 [Daucus carota subsp. sativus]